MRIDGAVIVVTGGARGIGAASAVELARRGARVAVGDLDPERIDAAHLGLPLDVADVDAWPDFLGTVEERLGPVDALVSNAGLMPVGPFVSETDAATRRQFEVNVYGVIAGCRAVLPGMLARRRGALVNIASQAGKAGFAGVATYTATKFAVVGLCQSLADELHDSGVSVSCVLPGVVGTELSAGLPDTPVTPRIAPEQVARAIADAIETGRREVWVPGSGRVAIPLAAAIPPRVRSRLSGLLGLDRPILHADAGARAAYEERISA